MQTIVNVLKQACHPFWPEDDGGAIVQASKRQKICTDEIAPPTQFEINRELFKQEITYLRAVQELEAIGSEFSRNNPIVELDDFFKSHLPLDWDRQNGRALEVALKKVHSALVGQQRHPTDDDDVDRIDRCLCALRSGVLRACVSPPSANLPLVLEMTESRWYKDFAESHRSLVMAIVLRLSEEERPRILSSALTRWFALQDMYNRIPRENIKAGQFFLKIFVSYGMDTSTDPQPADGPQPICYHIISAPWRSLLVELMCDDFKGVDWSEPFEWWDPGSDIHKPLGVLSYCTSSEYEMDPNLLALWQKWLARWSGICREAFKAQQHPALNEPGICDIILQYVDGSGPTFLSRQEQDDQLTVEELMEMTQ